jgi:hypothetical protein
MLGIGSYQKTKQKVKLGILLGAKTQNKPNPLTQQRIVLKLNPLVNSLIMKLVVNSITNEILAQFDAHTIVGMGDELLCNHLHWKYNVSRFLAKKISKRVMDKSLSQLSKSQQDENAIIEKIAEKVKSKFDLPKGQELLEREFSVRAIDLIISELEITDQRERIELYKKARRKIIG